MNTSKNDSDSKTVFYTNLIGTDHLSQLQVTERNTPSLGYTDLSCKIRN